MPALSASEPFVHEGCQISGSEFGAYVEIGQGSRVANSVFGDYSYCDRFADIANAQIGKFSNIASFTRIGPTAHPMDRASLHHFMYRSSYYWPEEADDAAFFEHRASRTAFIGHDTWIGHGAVIMPEVTVGHGAVVAAGAVVTKDVAPYEVVAGVAAQHVKWRFSRAVAERLVALAWWDGSHEELRARLGDFCSLSAEAFLEKYGG